MPVLYHHTISTHSRFIRVILSEYQISAEFHAENSWDLSAEVLHLSPSREVPVYINENMHAIIGASVISEYLDETAGVFLKDLRLLPADPLQRAEVRRLTHWYLEKFNQDVVSHLVGELVDKVFRPKNLGGGAPNTQTLRIARTNLAQHMKYLTWLTHTRDWLGGDTLSHADCAAAAALSCLDYLGEIDWNQYPQVKNWYQTMKSRPSFRGIISDRLRGLTPVPHYLDLDF